MIQSNLKNLQDKYSFDIEYKKRVVLVNEEIEKILTVENSNLLPPYKLNGYRDPLNGYINPITHMLWSGGKRIRPVLCMFASDAVGGNELKTLPTAAGLEFLHTFTLVHDDIMDNSYMRRGSRSIHSLWGEPIAIITGDALFSLAFKAFSMNKEIDGVTDEQVRRVIDLATEKSIALAKGQAMDLLFETRYDVNMDEYMKMIRLKTSSLMELSLQAGGILGNGNEDEIKTLEEFGSLSGMAFQIQDDILDIEGKNTGKPIGLDLKKGKKTVILIHALEHADTNEKYKIVNFLRKKKDSMEQDVGDIIETIRSIGSVEYAKQMVKKTLYKAEQKLSNFKNKEGTSNLRALVRYLVDRNR